MNEELLKAVDKVESIFLETNFANLFAPPFLFQAKAAIFELGTERFIKWFDSFKFKPVNNVWINAVNTKLDKEEIYSEEHFKLLGYGECISRSIAIPGFIDKGQYIDGGVANNPCLTQWDLGEDRPIFVSQLMMPYRRTPKSRIEKLFYSWDFKCFLTFQLIKNYIKKEMITFYPQISDISSVDFDLGKTEKEQMVKSAYLQTIEQLKYFKMDNNLIRKEICLALSGGGIRSGAHIGVVRALIENNYIPVKWAGTSGGAAFACLFAGIIGSMEKHE